MPVDPVAVAEAQVVPVVLAWLRGHPLIQDRIGGADHVSGVNRAPYPHIRVSDSAGGGTPDLVYLDEPELLVEVYSAMDGTPGYSALKADAMLVMAVLAQMPETLPLDPDRPVAITRVTPSSGLLFATDARVPDGSGQSRWYMTLRFRTHAVYGRT